MRDLEFLPAWYAQLGRRKRILKSQTLATLLAAGGMALWLLLISHNIRATDSTLASLRQQGPQVEGEVRQVARLKTNRELLARQDAVLDQLSRRHVESGRVLSRLADALPEGVTLGTIDTEIRDRLIPLTGLQRAAMPDAKSVPSEREMLVHIGGVAPSDVELASLLTELTKTTFFDAVTPVFSRDRREAGHILREFEVTFSIPLGREMVEAK